MPASTLRNLHVPLPEPLYRRLRAAAERVHRPATELAREAIDQWLAQSQKAAIHDAITSYAAACAGTHADLDPALEASAVEHLLDQDERGA
jgi:hypothetical protein